MRKSEAVALFGSVTAMARAMEITRQTIYAWPEELPQKTEDQIRGALLRFRVRVEKLIEVEK